YFSSESDSPNTTCDMNVSLPVPHSKLFTQEYSPTTYQSFSYSMSSSVSLLDFSTSFTHSSESERYPPTFKFGTNEGLRFSSMNTSIPKSCTGKYLKRSALVKIFASINSPNKTPSACLAASTRGRG